MNEVDGKAMLDGIEEIAELARGEIKRYSAELIEAAKAMQCARQHLLNGKYAEAQEELTRIIGVMSLRYGVTA